MRRIFIILMLAGLDQPDLYQCPWDPQSRCYLLIPEFRQDGGWKAAIQEMNGKCWQAKEWGCDPQGYCDGGWLRVEKLPAPLAPPYDQWSCTPIGSM